VLPAGIMRRFTWSGPAPVLDPLPRWVRADVLMTGDLTVSGEIVLGEGDHAREVQRMLLDGVAPAKLADMGVGWLVIESSAGGDMGSAARTLERLPAMHRGGDLVLYHIGGKTTAVPVNRRHITVIAHLVWLAMLAAGASGATVAGWRRCLRRGPRSDTDN
jgi:hypothetical protein